MSNENETSGNEMSRKETSWNSESGGLSADSIRLALVSGLVLVTLLVFGILALVWFSVSYQDWRDAADASLKRIERHLGTSFCSGDRELLDDVIYFSENGHSLDAGPPARKSHNDEALERLAKRLGRAPGTGVVMVTASASVDGDVLANLRLSEMRAHEVMKALQAVLKRELEASVFLWFHARWKFVAVPRGESYENLGNTGHLRLAEWQDENRKAWVELCRKLEPHQAREQAESGGGQTVPLRLGLLLGVFALAATLWWRAARTGDTVLLLLGSLQAGVAFVAGLSAWWWDAPAGHPWAGLVLGLHTTTVPYPFTVQNAIWIVLFLLVGNFGATLDAGKAGGRGAKDLWLRVWGAFSGLWRDGGK